jgi:hypothetical protein
MVLWFGRWTWVEGNSNVGVLVLHGKIIKCGSARCRCSKPGVPHVWALAFMSSLCRPRNHAYPPHHPNSTPRREATWGHLTSTKLSRRTWDASSPSKGGSYKYRSFYRLPRSSISTDRQHHYPEGDRTTLSGEGHEWLSHMMPYYSYRPTINNEMVVGYDIMRGTYTSDMHTCKRYVRENIFVARSSHRISRTW